jgi:hypothetical protein
MANQTSPLTEQRAVSMLDRAAHAFDNDDYAEVVIHSYGHRLGLAPATLRRPRSPVGRPDPPIPVPAGRPGRRELPGH